MKEGPFRPHQMLFVFPKLALEPFIICCCRRLMFIDSPLLPS